MRHINLDILCLMGRLVVVLFHGFAIIGPRVREVWYLVRLQVARMTIDIPFTKIIRP